MTPTFAIARTTGLVLVRHIEQAVGGRAVATVIGAVVGTAVVLYNVVAYDFLARFLPADAVEASHIDAAQLVDALAAAQVASAGGIAVLVLILAPGNSAVRVSAQVLSARRVPARLGESIPFVVLITTASGVLTIGPSVYLGSIVDGGPFTACTLLATNVASALGIAILAEGLRLVGTAVRLSSTVVQLIAVLGAVTVVGMVVSDSTAAARAGRTPAAATWSEIVTVHQGVDGSVVALSAAVLSTAVLLVTLLAVRCAQRLEPLGHPHRLVTLRRCLPRGGAWLTREIAMVVRQPIGQVSLAVSVVTVVLVSVAARNGVMPLSAALMTCAMLAAAPLELSWGRVATLSWVYRQHRTPAVRIVLPQVAAGMVWAVLLTCTGFGVIGTVPEPSVVVQHSLALVAAAGVAYAAGCVAPANAEVPASVAVTSVLAIVCETLVVWAGSRLDLLHLGLSGVLFGAVAVASLGAAVARIRSRLETS